MLLDIFPLLVQGVYNVDLVDCDSNQIGARRAMTEKSLEVGERCREGDVCWYF